MGLFDGNDVINLGQGHVSRRGPSIPSQVGDDCQDLHLHGLHECHLVEASSNGRKDWVGALVVDLSHRHVAEHDDRQVLSLDGLLPLLPQRGRGAIDERV